MKQLLILLALFTAQAGFGQTRVFTQDITHFYAAFDQVNRLSDRAEQLKTVQTLYVDKASDGLKDFIALGGGNAQKWLNYMRYNKEYLSTIRPLLEGVSAQIPEIQTKLSRVKEIYPAFKEGNIYFIVGCGLVGGSPNKQTGTLILGAEVLVRKNAEWALPSAIHEFIHIQQKDGNGQLLTQTIDEGVAEFLSELFFGKNLADNGYAPHIKFGNTKERKVWNRYKADMFVQNHGYMGWLYGTKTIAGTDVQDLGYFIGYKICKTFYDHATDKSAAIKTLLELDLASDESIRSFVLHSGYVTGKDLAFVKNAVFTDQKIEQKVQKTRFGYRTEEDKVVFEFKVPAAFAERYKGNIGGVSVAGSFNNWQPGLEAFQMVKGADASFRLVVPKSALNLPAVQQFKFVVNEDIWMPAPETAENVDAGSQNLILRDEK